MIDTKVIPAQQRTIIANTVTGQVFVNWSGDTQYLDNLNNKQAIVTMPDANITITSNYNILWANTVYGVLYNCYAANDSRGFVAGWHLPSDTEYNTLATTLGGTSVSGGYLKETGTTHWNTPNTGADNSSGFNGVGTGNRNPASGLFSLNKSQCSLWTSTWDGGDHYLAWILTYNNTIFNHVSYIQRWGNGVRLIKDSGTATSVVIDGITYPCVTIGGQCWMAENLKATHFANGDVISEVTDNTAWAALSTPAWCAYNNDHANL